ncbi:protein of unknown function [Ruminococcaceae bacterium BL-4]|nr:protein of unknown function [Ruminococcaceae bacterium BL-4]
MARIGRFGLVRALYIKAKRILLKEELFYGEKAFNSNDIGRFRNCTSQWKCHCRCQ